MQTVNGSRPGGFHYKISMRIWQKLAWFVENNHLFKSRIHILDEIVILSKFLAFVIFMKGGEKGWSCLPGFFTVFSGAVTRLRQALWCQNNLQTWFSSRNTCFCSFAIFLRVALFSICFALNDWIQLQERFIARSIPFMMHIVMLRSRIVASDTQFSCLGCWRNHLIIFHQV